jgi:hypothetical protein
MPLLSQRKKIVVESAASRLAAWARRRRNRSALLHEIKCMPICEEQIEFFVRIERIDIGVHLAHSLEGPERATWAANGNLSGSGSRMGARVLQSLSFVLRWRRLVPRRGFHG